MEYIKRHIEQKISSLLKQSKILVLTGARQVGKSTLLNNVLPTNFEKISLDDRAHKETANNDPVLFLREHPSPIFIDEIQKAPELFEPIKLLVDKSEIRPQYVLTSSESFSLIKGIKDNLSTRASLVRMVSLSNSEINKKSNFPFIPDLDIMLKRKCDTKTQQEVFSDIIKGSMPEVINGLKFDVNSFYQSYLESTIFKDIRDDQVKIQDFETFNIFMKSLSSLVGQEVNYSQISRDCGIDKNTVKKWINALIASNIIFFLHPYSHNLLKRTVKSPKLYFYDTGIPCYLMNYIDAQTLINSEYAGHIFECYAVSEIVKGFINDGRNIPPLYYLQVNSPVKKEIDLIVEGQGGILYPIEIKMSIMPRDKHFSNIGLLKPIKNKVGPMTLVCMATTFSVFKKDMYVLPVYWI